MMMKLADCSQGWPEGSLFISYYISHTLDLYFKIVVTEWELTKTEVRNEREIFIRLSKSNARQRREEGKPLRETYSLIIISTHHNSVKILYKERDIHINVHE